MTTPSDVPANPAPEGPTDPRAAFMATAQALRDRLKVPQAAEGPLAVMLTASPLSDQDDIVACDLCGGVVAASKLDDHFEYHAVVMHAGSAAVIFQRFVVMLEPADQAVDPQSEPEPTDAPVMEPSIHTHDHFPVEHRDGKEPWCPVCRLNASYEEPRPLGSSATEGS